MISKTLDENITRLDNAFSECNDTVGRRFPVNTRAGQVWAYIFYIDNLGSRDLLESSVINRLMLRTVENGIDLFEGIKNSGITTTDFKETEDFDDLVLAALSGDTALFFEGIEKALIISSKGWDSRGVSTAETEVVVQGPKEAFTETIRTNTVLVRRRIRDTNLKVWQSKIGRRSSTDIALMYLEDVVRPDILEEAKARLSKIDIDAALDVGHVAQLIEDNWRSVFPQAQITERPDKAAAAILEGRIAIVVDNSPFVMLVPVTLNTFFQSSEDYYERWQIMSLVRIIRYIAGIMAVALPGLYIAIAVYHPSMLPTLLVLKMAGARQSVPFPAIVEILIMEAAFELLREAGIRLPSAIGSTMGIVGGLIIGQAAVEAGLVSPIVVIIVAITGICGFAVPHVSLVSGFRLMKYITLFASAAFGLFGFWLAAFMILIHLVSLKSLGLPYMFPFASAEVNQYSDLKDTIFRMPSFMMKKRPIFANPKQQTRKS